MGRTHTIPSPRIWVRWRKGASASLEDFDEVSRVRGKALLDRGVRTIDLRVTLRRSVVSGSETLSELISRVTDTGGSSRCGGR